MNVFQLTTALFFISLHSTTNNRASSSQHNSNSNNIFINDTVIDEQSDLRIDGRKELRELNRKEIDEMIESFESIRQPRPNFKMPLFQEISQDSSTKEQLINRLEDALNLTLPYWDFELDRRLPNPIDSVLFHSDFLKRNHWDDETTNIVEILDDHYDSSVEQIEHLLDEEQTMHHQEALRILDRNNFTRFLYILLEVAKFSPFGGNSDCKRCPSGNKWLFCDFKQQHCVSKVVMNGNCSSFQQIPNVCHKSDCINGKCLPPSTTSNRSAEATTTNHIPTIDDKQMVSESVAANSSIAADLGDIHEDINFESDLQITTTSPIPLTQDAHPTGTTVSDEHNHKSGISQMPSNTISVKFSRSALPTFSTTSSMTTASYSKNAKLAEPEVTVANVVESQQSELPTSSSAHGLDTVDPAQSTSHQISVEIPSYKNTAVEFIDQGTTIASPSPTSKFLASDMPSPYTIKPPMALSNESAVSGETVEQSVSVPFTSTMSPKDHSETADVITSSQPSTTEVFTTRATIANDLTRRFGKISVAFVSEKEINRTNGTSNSQNASSNVVNVSESRAYEMSGTLTRNIQHTDSTTASPISVSSPLSRIEPILSSTLLPVLSSNEESTISSTMIPIVKPTEMLQDQQATTSITTTHSTQHLSSTIASMKVDGNRKISINRKSYSNEVVSRVGAYPDEHFLMTPPTFVTQPPFQHFINTSTQKPASSTTRSGKRRSKKPGRRKNKTRHRNGTEGNRKSYATTTTTTSRPSTTESHSNVRHLGTTHLNAPSTVSHVGASINHSRGIEEEGPSLVVHFSITVIEGEPRRKTFLNRRLQRCEITVTGMNMPSGYTQTSHGRLVPGTTIGLVHTLDPELHAPLVEFRIRVTDRHGRECAQKCLNNKGFYDICDRDSVRLTSHEFIAFSDPIETYESEEDVLKNQWSGKGYFKKRKKDYLLFSCARS